MPPPLSPSRINYRHLKRNMAPRQKLLNVHCSKHCGYATKSSSLSRNKASPKEYSYLRMMIILVQRTTKLWHSKGPTILLSSRSILSCSLCLDHQPNKRNLKLRSLPDLISRGSTPTSSPLMKSNSFQNCLVLKVPSHASLSSWKGLGRKSSASASKVNASSTFRQAHRSHSPSTAVFFLQRSPSRVRRTPLTTSSFDQPRDSSARRLAKCFTDSRSVPTSRWGTRR